MKKFLLILLCLPMIGFGQLFTSIPNNIQYSISTNTDPEANISFNNYDFQLTGNSGNKIIEKKLFKVMEDALNKKGWIRDVINPNYIFSIDFHIDNGTTTTSTKSRPVTTSRYNYSTNKTEYTTTQKVSSVTATIYERKFNIYIQSEDDLIWQGDLISHGTTQNIMLIGQHLLPKIIDFLGKNDIIKEFSHRCTLQCPDLSDSQIKKLQKEEVKMAIEIACGKKPKKSPFPNAQKDKQYENDLRDWKKCKKENSK